MKYLINSRDWFTEEIAQLDNLNIKCGSVIELTDKEVIELIFKIGRAVIYESDQSSEFEHDRVLEFQIGSD